MKNGTFYGARLKKVYSGFRSAAKVPEIPDADDPLTRLARGIFGVGTNEEVAREAVERILSAMVDWNEIRVSTIQEIQGIDRSKQPDEGERDGQQSQFDGEAEQL